MEVNEFDKVRLKDGRAVAIIDLTKPGIAYLAEIPVTEEDNDDLYDQFFVMHDEIAEILPNDYPMPNPYAKCEWWLEMRLEEYEQEFGEQFPRMLHLGMSNADIVAIVEGCLEQGVVYDPRAESGVRFQRLQ